MFRLRPARAWVLACLCLLAGFRYLAAAPVTLTGADKVEVSVDNPRRLVVFNPSTYEILEELGEAARVVGADSGTYAVIPGAAEKGLANFGHHALPSIEAVIAANPDLILANGDVLQPAVPTQLRSAGLSLLMLEHYDFDGIAGLKRRVAMVAAAVGREPEGRALIQRIDTRFAALQKANARITKPKRVFFLYAYGSAIYGGTAGSHQLIEFAGAQDAASSITGIKSISPEALVAAAPDTLIMMQRAVGFIGGVDQIWELPGVALTPAGRNHAVVVIDDGAVFIGPRFLDHIEQLHRDLYPDAK